MKTKRLGLVIIIFLLLLIISVFRTSYAFWEMNIIGNDKDDHSVITETQYLAVEYTDGTAVMNFAGDYMFPGNSAEKTFSVTNTGNAPTTYNILIDNVINEFERTQDLRYELYINDEFIYDGAINKNETQHLFGGINIGVGQTDNIKFVFTYAQTTEIQNMDMNKGISFRFNIDNKKEATNIFATNNINSSFLNEYKIYGNSIQDETTGEYTHLGEIRHNYINKDELLTYGTARKYIDIYLEAGTYYYKANIKSEYGVSAWIGLIQEGTLDYSGTNLIQTFDAFGQTKDQISFTLAESKTYRFLIYYANADELTKHANNWDDIYIHLTQDSYSSKGEVLDKYNIPIYITGKNLINNETLIENGFVLQEDNSYYVKYSSTPYKKVLFQNYGLYSGSTTFSYETKFVIANNLLGAFPNIFYTDGNYYPMSNKLNTLPTEYLKVELFIKTRTIKNIIWSYGTGTSQTYVKNMQLEKGSEATDYEPYKEHFANIVLDEPLRKVGDVADYVDFKKQVVVRYIDSNMNVLDSPIEQPIVLPSILLHQGINNVFTKTTIQPSNIYAQIYE